MKLVFEWNAEKATRNLARHRVSFEEAKTVFGDPLATTLPDEGHSSSETRYLTIGTSMRRRILIVVHTARGDAVRIISSREATRSERRAYENG